jgi:hypothetical protein
MSLQTSDTSPVDERPWRYVDVECAHCGTRVQVTKFSLQHTSVRWPGRAVLGCAEFAAAAVADGRDSAGGSGESPPRANTALIPTCASLRESIDDAVAAGRVEVLPP